MRHFSTQARTINIVRKMGYYPSHRVALRCAKALCTVLDMSDNVPLVTDYLTGDRLAWETLIQRMTPAEYRLINGFSDWYSGEGPEISEENSGSYWMDFDNSFSSYIASNLNTGFCFVFTSLRIKLSANGETLRPTESYDSEGV